MGLTIHSCGTLIWTPIDRMSLDVKTDCMAKLACRFQRGKSRISARRFSTAMLIAFSALGLPSQSRADAGRDFIVSCSYGVLAGTLVGAATLAFSDRPGDNLNKVARGASLGLYGGILLGAFVVFGGPAEDEDAAAQLNRTSLESGRGVNVSAGPRFLMYPLIGDRGLEGAAANLRIVSF
jgi:hypothetical protein